MEGCGTWSVRLRGGQQDGLLLLPNAGATKLSELRELVAQRAQRNEGTLLIKAGFPPKMLSAEGGPHVIISALGVTDMDTLILEWLPGTNTTERIQKDDAKGARKRKVPAAEEKAWECEKVTTTKSGRRSTCTSEKMAATLKEMREREDFAMGNNGKKGESKTLSLSNGPGGKGGGTAAAAAAATKSKKFKQAGKGYSLRDEGLAGANVVRGQAVGSTSSSATAVPASGGAAAGAGRRRVGGGLLSGLEATGLMSLGSEESNISAAQSDLATDLVSTFEPGRSKNPMRVALKDARAKQGAIEIATAREAAAMLGQVRFIEKQVGIQGNKVVTILEVRWQKGNDEMSETIANFPRHALAAILTELLREDQAKEFRVNIKPHNMACVSPRVFWNIVRHCQVGPEKDFKSALMELLPDHNWDVLLSRNMEEHTEGRYRYASRAPRPSRPGAETQRAQEQEDLEVEAEQQEGLEVEGASSTADSAPAAPP